MGALYLPFICFNVFLKYLVFMYLYNFENKCKIA